jgi:hypothetical protein
MSTGKRQQPKRGQVTKRQKVDWFFELSDEFCVLMARSIARTGNYKVALLLLSTAKRFNVQRRRIILKYGMFGKLTPRSYFSNLTEFCVLSHMDFPMRFLQKSKFTKKLHKYVLRLGKPSSVAKVNAMTSLLCSSTSSLIETVAHASALTSRFACDTDHPKMEHREHIIMRLFAHSISLEDCVFSEKIVQLVNPADGLLLSFYCDVLSHAPRLPQKHKNIVNIIHSLGNFDVHQLAFNRLFLMSVGKFSQMHKQINKDKILNPTNRAVFFLNVLFALFNNRRKDEAKAAFMEYASNYINPTPPTRMRMSTPARVIFVFAFLPIMGSALGNDWDEWLIANNFAIAD